MHCLLRFFAPILVAYPLGGCQDHAPTFFQASEPAAPHALRSVAGGTIPKDAIRGDFDGDGKAEYVWLVTPKLASDQESCVGECVTYLTCSNPAIKPFAIKDALGGKLTSFTQLAASGRLYVGLLPDWFTSCWRSYYVFKCQNRRWQYAVQPFSTHCNQWEDNVIPIEKDPALAGHVLIHYSKFEGHDIVTSTKSVVLQ